MKLTIEMTSLLFTLLLPFLSSLNPFLIFILPPSSLTPLSFLLYFLPFLSLPLSPHFPTYLCFVPPFSYLRFNIPSCIRSPSSPTASSSHLREERIGLEEHQHLLSQELSEKTLSECRLQDQCHLLQQRLIELESLLETREDEIEEVVGKLQQAETACSEGNVQMVQLRADLRSTEEKKNSMDSKVCHSKKH